VLAINDDAVAIKAIEVAIVERAFAERWIRPRTSASPSGRHVAVIGSGPAGLAAASQLISRGHSVTVYERDEAAGGLLRFGVPDFKLGKDVIDRRLALLEREGVEFRCRVDVGRDIHAAELAAKADAVIVATGARRAHELPITGRPLAGVHPAMDYLYARNRAVAAGQGRWAPTHATALSAHQRHVVVIGGGDTAMDCVGNAHRELAASVTLLDSYVAPVGTRSRELAQWPAAPRRLPSTYALDEGGERLWQHTAVALRGHHGRVSHVVTARAGPAPHYDPVPGTEDTRPAELVLIAIGFSGPEHTGPIEQLRLRLNARGTIDAPAFATSCPRVYAAGDARRGQSLVVWAIAEGRRCARIVDRDLMRAGEAERADWPTVLADAQR
jgi:glutamate synthase (NADPH/NADH) small chain